MSTPLDPILPVDMLGKGVLPVQPIQPAKAVESQTEINRKRREKDTISSVNDPLMQEINRTDAELTAELSKEQLNLVKIVNQMGKIQAMLARLTVQTYTQSINRNTDELNEIVVKLVGTFKTRNITWIMHGASFTIQVFSAVTGLGFMGATLKAGAASIGGVGQSIQGFTRFFEEEQNAQRTLLQFIMEENKRLRDNNASTKQLSMQDLKEAIQMAKKADEESSSGVRTASNL